MNNSKLSHADTASYLLAALALLLVLKAGLLVALFSGLLMFSAIHRTAPLIARRFSRRQPRMIAVALLSALLMAALVVSIWGIHVFLRSDSGNLHNLLQRLADIIDASRSQVPEWVSTYFPDDVVALQEMITLWLREHASEAKLIVPEAGHLLVHLLLGMIIGVLVALRDMNGDGQAKPFAAALLQRLRNLSLLFEKIVFAQVQISLINTVLAAIYLLVILPLSGVHLPLTKTMIAITFLAGLIPVAGNIVSNSLLVIIALSHSLNIAISSLLFMVLIHKAEYFLNARIIGAQVNARAWELLTAILVFETLFGVPGLVAAPVFYAYLKKELSDRGLV
ncbi:MULTISPECIES: AI-2E family transporter [unclassified Undibacterium]|uniref:AI-2E family transporter n=1 Tax=unclassified Undibacterium TaxID=2630295 RepID=UPI002AC9B7FD|nr:MULTISPECIES: AI-2E family transporter [unclassified Undibacterium]MEB0138903.1 AI-2E family transporter [Undibacterium sp. CCC2.1]MEB0171766.1 AI-2E family transporter [Undibacterium sp. CCC1.1]MEB0175534.1 AI-2E family transporter [Undibacterium sp. CCC3.4]MEB0214968.1 AI-2E family transporter [Undibacterium sp. 5I2]WPX44949.1 AI-2E family transporter [Undibacterium sp. CCC3.4]